MGFATSLEESIPGMEGQLLRRELPRPQIQGNEKFIVSEALEADWVAKYIVDFLHDLRQQFPCAMINCSSVCNLNGKLYSFGHDMKDVLKPCDAME